MPEPRNPGIIPGVILVALGLALLVAQLVPGVGGEVVPFGLGLAFLAVYFYTHLYGFLVPGGILTGLGLGIIAQQHGAGAGAVVIGLGCGFLLVWAIDRVTLRFSNFWPLIPGGILLTVGLMVALPGLRAFASLLWPIALIVVGVILLITAFGNRQGNYGPK